MSSCWRGGFKDLKPDNIVWVEAQDALTRLLYSRMLGQGPSGTSTVRIIDFNCARRGLTERLYIADIATIPRRLGRS